MKTLEEIQDEVSKENGYHSYNDLHMGNNALWPTICKRFAIEVARAALDNAAVNAKMRTKYTSCSEWCGSDECSPTCANGREYQVIDATTINNESNIPKI